MAKLYELNQAIENFIFQIDEETGEIVNINELENLRLEKNEKLENIALYYKNLLSDAEQFKKEEDVFKERRERAMKKAESLKTFLNNQLCGEPFKTLKVDIKYRTSESVEIVDLKIIPNMYIKYEPKPNKTAIKNVIKTGGVVEGAKIVTKQNIQIK